MLCQIVTPSADDVLYWSQLQPGDTQRRLKMLCAMLSKDYFLTQVKTTPAGTGWRALRTRIIRVYGSTHACSDMHVCVYTYSTRML